MNGSHEAKADEAPNAAVDDEMATGAADDAELEVEEVDGNQSLEQLQSEISALKEEVLRERAEAENVRKRAQRDVEAAHKYGLERLVQQLLPVKDSMDMGLEASQTATDLDALREGMTLTAKMFADCFEKLNIKAINPAGERFDPEFHQAMTTEESVEVDAGTVLRVMQCGYSLNERLVRPALVVVAKAPAGNDA